jgi:hypothetical protein
MPAWPHYPSMLAAPRTLLVVLAACLVAMLAALMATQRQASATRVLEEASVAQPATVAGQGFVLAASANGGAVCLDYSATQGGSYGSCVLAPDARHPVTTALSREPNAGRMHVYGATVSAAHAVELVTSSGVQRLPTHALPSVPDMRAFAAPPLAPGAVTRVTALDASGRPLS